MGKPSITKRISTALSYGKLAFDNPVPATEMRAQVKGMWEGWEINHKRDRPSKRTVSADADLNFGTREAMMSEARALCQTEAIAARIPQQFANYVVGGCTVQVKTSDEDWNEQAERFFASCAGMADFTGRHDLQTMAKIGIESILRDGDIFFNLTDKNGVPQLQAIEADRVGNYNGGTINVDTPKMIGGVSIDDDGIPIGYQVNQRGAYGAGNFSKGPLVSARSVIHLFSPTRFDAYRGVTHFHSALNHVRDKKEIIAAEKMGVKLESSRGLTIRNSTGTASGEVSFRTGKTNTNGEPITYEQIHPGLISYQVNGDSVEWNKSQRPSPAWQGFIQLLVQEIAIGFDLPVEFVWSMAGMTGPGVRMSAKQAERTFKKWIGLLERKFLNRYYTYVITWGMENGRIPFNPEWYKFRFQRPSMPGIDAGRESDKNIKERQAGLMTGQEICDERGMDIFEVLEQNAREVQAAMAIAKEYGVPFELVMQIGKTTANESEDEEESEQPKKKGKAANTAEKEDEE